MDFNVIAKMLLEARNQSEAVPQVTTSEPAFTIEDAYSVQSKLMALDIAAGGELGGFKMGLTSLAKQKDVGVSEPICGSVVFSEPRGVATPQPTQASVQLLWRQRPKSGFHRTRLLCWPASLTFHFGGE